MQSPFYFNIYIIKIKYYNKSLTDEPTCYDVWANTSLIKKFDMALFLN